MSPLLDSRVHPGRLLRPALLLALLFAASTFAPSSLRAEDSEDKQSETLAPAEQPNTAEIPANPETVSETEKSQGDKADRSENRKKKERREKRLRQADAEPFTPVIVKLGEKVSEAVSVFASTLVDGEVRGDSVAVFGHNTTNGKVGGDSVSVFGPNKITGSVGGDAVSVFGNLYIDGEVMGDSVCVFGSKTLGPKAVLHGENVTVFGSLHTDPEAKILGKTQTVPFGSGMPGMGGVGTWVDECLLKGRLVCFSLDLAILWIGLAFIAVINALIALIARRPTEHCIELLNTQPGKSVLSALLTVLLTPPLVILLAITGIGAALIPFVFIGGMIVTVFGHVVMQAWTGRALSGSLGSAKRPLHVFVAALLGGLAITLLCAVPFIGLLVMPLLGFLGTGVVVYALVRRFTGRNDKTPAAPAARPAPVTAAQSAAPVAPLAPTSPNPASPASEPAAPSITLPPLQPLTLTPEPSPSTSTVAGDATPVYASAATLPEAPQLPPLMTPPMPEPAVAPAKPFASAAAPSVSANTATAAIPLSGLERATFGTRMLALLIDFILVAVAANFFAGMLPSFLKVNISLGGLGILLAAYGAMMWKCRGATVGDIIFRLKVIRSDDSPLDWTTCIVRGLGCLLSGVALGIGFIWIAYDPEREAWHDKIAGTAVVRLPKSQPLV